MADQLFIFQHIQVNKHNNESHCTSETSAKRYLGLNKFHSVTSKFINPSTNSQK